jgi:DNA (cytosine-5)-methyltransferase 1
MIYGSVCSGIEAATVAWRPLGWRAAFYSQFDPEHKGKGPDFASAVLAHHYPDTPNRGDMTRFKEWPGATIDLLVGGTPCQSFSIAGLRKGLDDPRGNLMLTYLAIAQRYRPSWLVWENVPGVLSVDEGRAFGTLLGGMAELGYHAAWRVLDAEYVRVDGFARAVPQRRRRVFVVGYLGDWRRAAAVLFERESLSGNSPPRRETWKGLASSLAARTRGGGGLGTDFDLDGGLIAARTIQAGGHSNNPIDENLVAQIAFGGGNTVGSIDVATARNGHAVPHGRLDFESETFVAHPILGKENSSHDHTMDTYVSHALRADGFDASEDGTGRGTPLVPTAFDCKAGGKTGFAIGDVPGSIRGDGHGGGHAAVALSMREEPHKWAVRRLTPEECEALQAIPRGYTLIPWRGKLAPDGPRYKALGNSFAVNVIRWIGHRIEKSNAIAPNRLAQNGD